MRFFFSENASTAFSTTLARRCVAYGGDEGPALVGAITTGAVRVARGARAKACEDGRGRTLRFLTVRGWRGEKRHANFRGLVCFTRDGGRSTASFARGLRSSSPSGVTAAACSGLCDVRSMKALGDGSEPGQGTCGDQGGSRRAASLALRLLSQERRGSRRRGGSARGVLVELGNGGEHGAHAVSLNVGSAVICWFRLRARPKLGTIGGCCPSARRFGARRGLAKAGHRHRPSAS